MIVNDENVLNLFSKVRENKTKSAKLMKGISSGKRVNNGADVAIQESFKAQVRSISRAQRNTEEGISMLQTVDGALSNISNQLMRMEKISIQAANDTLEDKDRKLLDKEFQSIKTSISEIMENTSFNDIKLLSGAEKINIQTGDNPYTTYTIDLKSVDLSYIGLDNSSVTNLSNAVDSIDNIKNAVSKIADYRNQLGGDYNNLYHSYNHCNNSEYSTTAALSKIEDTDMAMSAIDLIKGQILEKCSYSILVSSRTEQQSLASVVNKLLFS
ncbi:flagellin [Clostridium sp. Marseille-Q2269]|uniref:flagellin N-terminal helical domain-containing protein n=1 Tax=Clostridium sp. Marseille-Q2269 TaxID=2942205 RepID=UPI002074A937|nr:flagellin [Clostridium sp. Marseille-Q2269]